MEQMSLEKRIEVLCSIGDDYQHITKRLAFIVENHIANLSNDEIQICSYINKVMAGIIEKAKILEQ